MKILYTILFFISALLLFALTYLLLSFIDSGVTEVKFAIMIFAIVICIFMLVYFLTRYINLPSSVDQQEF
jgi:membrane protein DedA with SNARE-associated domain